MLPSVAAAAIPAAISSGGGIFQSLMNASFARRNAELNYEYNKKLMAAANKYEEIAFNRETARQDFLMNNSANIMKNSLKAAGYNTADPNGTGVTPATSPSMQGPSNPGMNVSMSPPDLTGIFQSVAQARLLNSQARLNEVDVETRARSNEAKLALLQNDLKVSNDTLSERIGSVKSQYFNLTKQNKKLDMEIGQVEASMKNLELNNEILKASKNVQIEKFSQELQLLIKQNKIQEVESKLAEKGILLGANGIQSLVAIAQQGSSEELVGMIGELFTAITKELPPVVKTVFDALVDAIKGLMPWNR